jgi:hypothetical protein
MVKMSEVISFPNKKNEDPEKKRSPLETLVYLAEMFAKGETNADQMVVCWACQREGALELRYMIGGEDNLTGAVGMLEMAKHDLLE